MKLTYEPDGGKWGYGFNYFCAECDAYIGCSSEDDYLEHPASTKETVGWLRKRVIETIVTCKNAGKKCELPKHEIDAKEII